MHAISDKGEIVDYLGVKVDTLADGCIKLSQPLFTQHIGNDLSFNTTKTQSLPAFPPSILHCDLDGTPFNKKWVYTARSRAGSVSSTTTSLHGRPTLVMLFTTNVFFSCPIPVTLMPQQSGGLSSISLLPLIMRLFTNRQTNPSSATLMRTSQAIGGNPPPPCQILLQLGRAQHSSWPSQAPL